MLEKDNMLVIVLALPFRNFADLSQYRSRDQRGLSGALGRNEKSLIHYKDIT